MKFTPLALPGAFLVDIEAQADQRGFFARTVCVDEFARHGLEARFVQQSVSFNPNPGTLRGLHFQAEPHQEEKLVRVTRGALFDVLVDLRRDSPFYGRWCGVQLDDQRRQQLYIPKGVAHGFQTLCADTEIFYQMSVPFEPSAARGLRWDDAALAIAWPECVRRLVSDKDRALPCMGDLT